MWDLQILLLMVSRNSHLFHGNKDQIFCNCYFHKRDQVCNLGGHHVDLHLLVRHSHPLLLRRDFQGYSISFLQNSFQHIFGLDLAQRGFLLNLVVMILLLMKMMRTMTMKRRVSHSSHLLNGRFRQTVCSYYCRILIQECSPYQSHNHLHQTRMESRRCNMTLFLGQHFFPDILGILYRMTKPGLE